MAYALAMSEDDGPGPPGSLPEQLLGRIARELLESRALANGVGKAFAARSRAVAAQEAALGLLSVPSAGDIERLTRRVRSIGDRLGAIEDALSRVEGALRRHSDALGGRLEALERELATARRELADLGSARVEEPVVVSRDQEALLRATGVG